MNRLSTRIWVAVIAAIGAIVVAVIQTKPLFSAPDPPPEASALKNTGGEIGRLEAIDGCGSAPWIEILMDGSVRIGLIGTTTSARPQSASFFVEHRPDPGAGFQRIGVLDINVGRTTALRLPDGRFVNVQLDAVSSDNCTARYSLALQN
jgi:hypothetical protein